MSKNLSSKYGFRNKSKEKPRDKVRDQTKKSLFELDVRPSKERGQNFLVNDLVVSSIIEFGAPKKDEYIVEIGPGLGALTKALVPYGLKAVIEIEQAFADEVSRTYPDIAVKVADARYFDFKSFGQAVTIFANLPYSISSEMILSLCENGAGVVKRVVLMLQKEFAQRLCAEVGSKDYGILSVFSQKAAHTRLGPIIGAEYFHPRPKIDSQVLEFRFKPDTSGDKDEAQKKLFRKVVRAAFAKRRKIILNSLLSVNLASEDILTKALEAAEILPTCRAQELGFLQFERLTKELSSILDQEPIS